jgi:hypothetical protein
LLIEEIKITRKIYQQEKINEAILWMRKEKQ